MKYESIVDDIQSLQEEEIKIIINHYQHKKLQQDVYSQIENCNFVLNKTCVEKFLSVLKEYYIKASPAKVSAGILVDEENDNKLPAIKLRTPDSEYVLTADAVYTYWYYNKNKVFKKDEFWDLSIEWLNIIKQTFGVGYIQKMILLAQKQCDKKIDRAQKELDEYSKKFNDLDKEVEDVERRKKSLNE